MFVFVAFLYFLMLFLYDYFLFIQALAEKYHGHLHHDGDHHNYHHGPDFLHKVIEMEHGNHGLNSEEGHFHVDEEKVPEVQNICKNIQYTPISSKYVKIEESVSNTFHLRENHGHGNMNNSTHSTILKRI